MFREWLLQSLLLRHLLFRGLFGDVHGIITGEFDTFVGSTEGVEHIERVLLVLVLAVCGDRFLLLRALLPTFVSIFLRAVGLHDGLVVLLLPLLQVLLGELGHGDRLPAAELGERGEEGVRGLPR